MKFVIWSIGARGKMLLNCLQDYRIVAIIDRDPDLIGKDYRGIPVITLEEYRKKCGDCYIIVSSSVYGADIIRSIDTHGIKRYFDINRAPSELPNWEDNLPFAEMIAPYKDKLTGKRVVLWGINVFTLLLYDYLQQNDFRVTLADNKDEADIIRELKQDGEYEFSALNTDNSVETIILKTDRFIDKTAKEPPEQGICFYRFPYLSQYDYPSLRRFRDVHRGKRCFVVATGPSLRIEDLDILREHGEICLSMNFIYKGFSKTKWRPDYIFWEDSDVSEELLAEINDIDVKYKFWANRRIKRVRANPKAGIYVYKDFSEYFGEEGPDFSADAEEGVFYAYTVAYQCLQFAVYMGFGEIYIIGADCDYKNAGGAGDHFIDDYYSDKIDVSGIYKPHANPNDGFAVDKVFFAYRKAREYADSHGIKIYNATRGGKLEAFERVDFDKLFV